MTRHAHLPGERHPIFNRGAPRDPDLRRSIIIRKTGSLSTVVWNPWSETAKRMTDLGDDEWLHMVCVESGNIKAHTHTLAPGEISTLKVEIDSVALV